MNSCLSTLLAAVLAVAMVGCGKEKAKEKAPAAKPDATKVESTMKAVGDAADKTAAEAKESVDEAKATVDEAAAGVKETVADSTGKFDALVAAIRGSIADNSLDKAQAGLLEALALPGLTGEQKGILAQLKEAIANALKQNAATKAADATKAAADRAVKGIALPKLGHN